MHKSHNTFCLPASFAKSWQVHACAQYAVCHGNCREGSVDSKAGGTFRQAAGCVSPFFICFPFLPVSQAQSCTNSQVSLPLKPSCSYMNLWSMTMLLFGRLITHCAVFRYPSPWSRHAATWICDQWLCFYSTGWSLAAQYSSIPVPKATMQLHEFVINDYVSILLVGHSLCIFHPPPNPQSQSPPSSISAHSHILPIVSALPHAPSIITSAWQGPARPHTVGLPQSARSAAWRWVCCWRQRSSTSAWCSRPFPDTSPAGPDDAHAQWTAPPVTVWTVMMSLCHL